MNNTRLDMPGAGFITVVLSLLKYAYRNETNIAFRVT